MPNKLFEASFAGLPIIAADLAEMSRFIKAHNLGVTYDALDQEACARTIMEVYRNVAAYRKSPEELAEYRAAFSWERQEEKIGRIVGSLVPSPASEDFDRQGFEKVRAPSVRAADVTFETNEQATPG